VSGSPHTNVANSSKNYAVGRPLQWVDTYGGHLLGIPPWYAGAGKNDLRRGGDLMRFYTKQHKFYGGIDLHARTMYLCILNQDGEIILHHNMKTAPEPLLKAIAPYRGGLVVCNEHINILSI
jgi:hypothetical protein